MSSVMMKKNIVGILLMFSIMVGMITEITSVSLFFQTKESERNTEMMVAELIREGRELMLKHNDEWYRNMTVFIDSLRPEYLMVPPETLKSELSNIYMRNKVNIIETLEQIEKLPLVERVRTMKELWLKLHEEHINYHVLLIDKINPVGFKKSPEAVKEDIMESYLRVRRKIIEAYEDLERSLEERISEINRDKYLAIVGGVVSIAVIIGSIGYLMTLLGREEKSLG